MPTQSRSGAGDGGRGVLRRSLVRGTALVIPLAVTLLVLKVLLDFLLGALAPVVGVVELLFGLENVPVVVVQAGTGAVLLASVVAIGYVAERRQGASHPLSDDFDAFMAAIPGLGSVYTGFRRVSETLLESDADSFRDVKMVEFPREETYMLGFTTAEPPETVREEAGHEDMLTLFVPLAPNPVMGGFLVHVPEERVVDLDMSVEEGVTAIMTSGVAADGEPLDERSLGELHDHVLEDHLGLGDRLDGDDGGGDDDAPGR